MHRRQRAVVTRVARLQHVERFAAAHLADHDAIGPHAQRRPYQLAHAHRACAFGVRGPGLEPDDVRLRRGEARPSPRWSRCARARRWRARARCSTSSCPELVAPDDHDVPTGAHHRVHRTRRPAPARRTSASGTVRAPKRRIVRHGPSGASGGSTACRRAPSGRRASTIGDARSSRSPSGAMTRSATRTIVGASIAHATGSMRPARSTYTRSGPFTMISVMVGIGEQRLDRPEPTDVVEQLLEHFVGRDHRRAAALPRGTSWRAGPATPRGGARPDRTAWRAGADAAIRGRCAVMPRALTRQASEPRERVAQRARQRVGHARVEDAGVDRPRDRGARFDRCQHRQAEHVFDVARAQRSPVLVDQDRAAGEFDRLVVNGSAQREVTAAHDDDVRVGDLGQREQRGMIEAARIAHRRARVGAERDRQRGPRLGRHRVERAIARGKQSEAVVDDARELLERVDRCARPGVQPVAQTERRARSAGRARPACRR